jgi:hypothetical protein
VPDKMHKQFVISILGHEDSPYPPPPLPLPRDNAVEG